MVLSNTPPSGSRHNNLSALSLVFLFSFFLTLRAQHTRTRLRPPKGPSICSRLVNMLQKVLHRTAKHVRMHAPTTPPPSPPPTHTEHVFLSSQRLCTDFHSFLLPKPKTNLNSNHTLILNNISSYGKLLLGPIRSSGSPQCENGPYNISNKRPDTEIFPLT